jgi:phage FluMu gp28-like protein
MPKSTSIAAPASKAPASAAKPAANTAAKFFLPYQSRWIKDGSRLKLMEKSRQIGFSWCDAYDTVEETSGTGWPLDCWVSSRDKIQAQLYGLDCQRWAESFKVVADDLGEILIDTEGGQKVSALRLPFANGRSVYNLSSNVDAQAGKRGTRKLDEFALNKDNRRLYAIAYPGIQWGGRLVIFSTHRGNGNFFNELIRDIKHGGNKKGFSLHTVTFEDALCDGLLVKLKHAWRYADPQDPRLDMTEAEFYELTRDQCPDEETFMEEYMCSPSDDGAAFLEYDLITRAEYQPGTAWETDLEDAKSPIYLGVDIGRKHDLTVITVLEQIAGIFLTRRLIELRGMPFSEQEEILYPLLELPQVRRCAIDRTGLGMQFAERAAQKFGTHKIQEVNFSAQEKARMAYPVRALFEDGRIKIPSDRNLRADLRAVKKETTGDTVRFTADRGKNGHADRFWSIALAVEAGREPADPYTSTLI